MDYFAILLWQKVYSSKSNKGQAFANFLVEHPLSEDLEFKDNLLDESMFLIKKILEIVNPELHYIMYFDRTSRTNEFGEIISRVGIIFYGPNRVYVSHSFSLCKPCSNNDA